MVTCAQIALALIVLGMLGAGVIFSMGVEAFYRGRLHFQSIGWRLSWWASCLSFLVGVALWAFFCDVGGIRT